MRKALIFGPEMTNLHETTQIVLDLSRGKRDAAAKLTPLVYDQLHALANRFMRQERAGHTLQATALINEVYLRLVDQAKIDSRNRTQFVALAAEMMRRILVDHARKRAATAAVHRIAASVPRSLQTTLVEPPPQPTER